MNKLLTTIANDSRLSKGVVLTGAALSTIGNLFIFVGVFYTALNKGFTLGQQVVDDTEVDNG